MRTPAPRGYHRAASIFEADLSVVCARRRARACGESPQLIDQIDADLRRACRYYLLAGLSFRADTLARYGWRLVKLRRIHLPLVPPTLSERSLDARFNPERRGARHV